MDNEQERNEHFKGFAELLYQELSELEGSHETLISEYRNKYDKQDIIRLIAQRAYDLANHTIDSLWPYINDKAVEPSATDIPDLIEWPNPQ